jgi:GNAT superfamily N-acetyltransferase
LIDKLEWDSKFFGRGIGRLTKVQPEKKLRSLIQQAHKKGYEYLSCRLILDKIAEIQLLERHEFYLTDIGVVWEKKVVKNISNLKPQISSSNIREATDKDVPMLKKTVKGLFKDSRFYNDPFFTEAAADKLYQVWVENSLKDKTIKAFVAEKSGFITCKILSKTKGNIPLVGVVKEAQGKGIGIDLMHQALKWFVGNGIKTITVRTQANNISARDFYKGLGFRIKHVDVTMGMILRK